MFHSIQTYFLQLMPMIIEEHCNENNYLCLFNQEIHRAPNQHVLSVAGNLFLLITTCLSSNPRQRLISSIQLLYLHGQLLDMEDSRLVFMPQYLSFWICREKWSKYFLSLQYDLSITLGNLQGYSYLILPIILTQVFLLPFYE